MRQWTGSALVQGMACLFGIKSLPEPMLVYCQLDSWEQISVKFELEFYHFQSRKCIWNCRLPKWWPFCPRGDELTLASNSSSPGNVTAPGHHLNQCWFMVTETLIIPLYPTDISKCVCGKSCFQTSRHFIQTWWVSSAFSISWEAICKLWGLKVTNSLNSYTKLV